MRQKKFTQSRDDFTDYRELCESRLKRLERYKKTRSFCSLETNEASTSSECGSKKDETNSNLAKLSLPHHQTPYDLLREKMISLMETDNQLLRQLLTLADTVKELREKQPIQRSASETSLSSGNCEENEDELRPMAERQNKFGASVTHLYLNGENDNESETDEMENLPNFQYFSRKNSVLRIPIQPRASNRILGKKIPRRPSELIRPRVTKTVEQKIVEEELCRPLEVEEHSSPSSSQHSPDNNSISDCCENGRKTTNSAASIIDSIDSGIRDDETSSPTIDQNSDTDCKQILDI